MGIGGGNRNKREYVNKILYCGGHEAAWPPCDISVPSPNPLPAITSNTQALSAGSGQQPGSGGCPWGTQSPPLPSPCDMVATRGGPNPLVQLLGVVPLSLWTWQRQSLILGASLSGQLRCVIEMRSLHSYL